MSGAVFCFATPLSRYSSMKNSLFKTSCALLALSYLPLTWAVLPSTDGPLSNYDKRYTTPQPLVATTSAARENARSLLSSRIPNIKIATDRFLGTPRWISAPRGFLTGPLGEGGAV